MKKLLNSILSLSLVTLLVSCSSHALKSSAKDVRLTKTDPSSRCKFLGDVTGSQGNFITGPLTSNENMETGARNNLKNKACELGANVVYLITSRAGHSGSSEQTNVTLSGSAYKCN